MRPESRIRGLTRPRPADRPKIGLQAGQSFRTPVPAVEVTRDAPPDLEALLIRDLAGLEVPVSILTTLRRLQVG
jgi:hypothetical protein